MTELPAGYVQVQGTNRSPAPGATRVGSAEPAEQMSVSIRLRRRPGAEALRGLLQGGDSIERYCKQIFEREAEAG